MNDQSDWYKEKISQEYRELRAKTANEANDTAKWLLIAAAAGALACLNGIITVGISHEIASILAIGINGFVLSMVSTIAGMSFKSGSYHYKMFMWAEFDKPPGDSSDIENANKLSKSAKRHYYFAFSFTMAGYGAFMGTMIWGGWAIQRAIENLAPVVSQ